jgi:lipopolysaccharide transport system ATP-binding protein
MAEPVIVVQGLSKRYRLGVIGRHTLRDEARYWWHRLNRRDPFRHMAPVDLVQNHEAARALYGDVFWALQDITFEVRAGEVVGIVGCNGAGKSTLLRILCRITGPTSGEAWLRGRVGALLEVGTGFHGELTGRENVFMNGAILGMRQAEIARKFDRIVEFAEIGEFLDTPVKRYSSGMRVRLAFAVAAHLEPEIMLVDEVLAVGDARFQQKCLGAMEAIGAAGRTVLFVSHHMGAIVRLCSRCLWLDAGRIRMDGPAREVVAAYLAASGIRPAAGADPEDVPARSAGAAGPPAP